MMGRFCRYVDKVFQFGQRLQTVQKRLMAAMQSIKIADSEKSGTGELGLFDVDQCLHKCYDA